MAKQFSKAPGATLDFKINWQPGKRPYLTSGEILVDSVWFISTGITKVSDTFTDTTSTVWLSGGVLGQRYKITNRITTSLNRIDERNFTVLIKEHYI